MDSKTLALIATLVLATTMTMNNTNSPSSWDSFKSTHGKVYASAEEESYRQAVYMVNEAKINAHNDDNTQTYTMAVNHMSDLTHEEYKSMYLGYKPSGNVVNAEDDGANQVGDVNWVTKGAV